MYPEHPQVYSNILKMTKKKSTENVFGETRSKLVRRHAHFPLIRRTIFISYGVSCTLRVEINNFYCNAHALAIN